MFMSRTGPVPIAAMSRPATPGPISRPALNEALLSETALASTALGTTSETKVCRAGLSTAVTMPWTRASA